MTDSVTELVDKLRLGDVRALGRAISLVEGGDRDDHASRSRANEVLAACFPFTGGALRIGITGAPGAGKSTLVDRLARGHRAAGKTVGVVAVDPSSPFTGGAILGDRIRFQGFSADPGFYARSMATRGALGGLARTSADVAMVVEASGKEIVIIETVGVGQDEVDIARMADITLVVLVPGMGDDVQSLKAGVLEIADLFVLNKNDREGADRLDAELRAMQSLGHTQEGEWTAPVVRTIASTDDGLPELLAAISSCFEWLGEKDRLQARRAGQWRVRLMEMVCAEMLREIRLAQSAEMTAMATQIVDGSVNPFLPESLAPLVPASLRSK